MLVFIHIPKTAGTAVADLLSRNYPDGTVYRHGATAPYSHLKRLKEEISVKYQAFCGHVSISEAEEIPGEKRYFPILRRPLDRIYSNFLWVRRRQAHSLYSLSPSGFEYFLANCLAAAEKGTNRAQRINSLTLLNGQCRFLCDKPDAAAAVERCQQKNVMIGRQENLDIFIERIATKEGWRLSTLDRINATPNKGETPRISEELYDVTCREDQKLYLHFSSTDPSSI